MSENQNQKQRTFTPRAVVVFVIVTALACALGAYMSSLINPNYVYTYETKTITITEPPKVAYSTVTNCTNTKTVTVSPTTDFPSLEVASTFPRLDLDIDNSTFLFLGANVQVVHFNIIMEKDLIKHVEIENATLQNNDTIITIIGKLNFTAKANSKQTSLNQMVLTVENITATLAKFKGMELNNLDIVIPDVSGLVANKVNITAKTIKLSSDLSNIYVEKLKVENSQFTCTIDQLEIVIKHV